jgi:CheY-like chemotaxis protein
MTGSLPGPPAGKSARVLVVEDHPFAADALRLIFEATGYSVRVAQTAAAAVQACEEEPPDLMILDLTLPDGDGLSVLHTVTEAGASPRVTVALTGHDDAALSARCREAGCTAVLLKPVPPRDLLTRAAQWLA